MPNPVTADFRGQGTNAGKGVVAADSFIGLPGIVDSNGALVPAVPTYYYNGSATLAELNAGKTLIADIPGKTIKPVSYLLTFNGNFTTATDIRLQDSNGTPIVIATVAIANATTGNKASSESVGTGVTDGAGLNANLTAGKGIKLVKTGSSAAGGTSIGVKIIYTII